MNDAASGYADPPEFVPLAAPWKPADDRAKLVSLQSITATELGEWIDRLRRAGVAADRRSSPNLFAQLGQALRRPIDTVLCSLLDTDPSACLNSSLAARYGLELAAGVLIVGRITHAGRTSLVADARLPSSWLTSLRQSCRLANIRIEQIINDYPQTDPTLMLYGLLGRRLRPGRLPTDQGVVLLDAAAAVAIGRCALLDEPMLQAPIAVRDHVQGRSHFAIATVGTTIAELLDQLKLPLRGRVVFSGDLLRDARVQGDAIVGGGELVLHSAAPLAAINPDPCIRCGWCVDVCPTRLNPAMALEAAQGTDLAMAERAGIEACIECGLCSYVCPSHLPLLEAVQGIKGRGQRAEG